mmetsp:Transcript_5296/g.9004  ORF Transcript_5296/g.9004 Transcript_5296/m.9004 type:complete len:384 (-) Transcript_5296:187-1338(-)
MAPAAPPAPEGPPLEPWIRCSPAGSTNTHPFSSVGPSACTTSFAAPVRCAPRTPCGRTRTVAMNVLGATLAAVAAGAAGYRGWRGRRCCAGGAAALLAVGAGSCKAAHRRSAIAASRSALASARLRCLLFCPAFVFCLLCALVSARSSSGAAAVSASCRRCASSRSPAGAPGGLVSAAATLDALASSLGGGGGVEASAPRVSCNAGAGASMDSRSMCLRRHGSTGGARVSAPPCGPMGCRCPPGRVRKPAGSSSPRMNMFPSSMRRCTWLSCSRVELSDDPPHAVQRGVPGTLSRVHREHVHAAVVAVPASLVCLVGAVVAEAAREVCGPPLDWPYATTVSASVASERSSASRTKGWQSRSSAGVHALLVSPRSGARCVTRCA